MAPTTVTTLFMIVAALAILALTAYAYLGSWNLAVPRPAPVPDFEAEYDAAVVQMRQAIVDYEQGRRSL